MSELLAIGISHKTAHVAMRERVALTEREAERFMRELVAREERARGGRDLDLQPHRDLPRRRPTRCRRRPSCSASSPGARRIRPTELVDVVYSPRNCDAARHLFRVTSGLDSMIVGESEVQGQVRRAYEAALAAGTTGPFTNRLFRAALQTGKRVRTETAVSQARVSVSSVAVDLAREAVGDLARALGAHHRRRRDGRADRPGAARAGRRARCSSPTAAPTARSALAERFGGRVGSLDELPDRLVDADIVVASTSSPHPIVGADELRVVMDARGGRPIVLIDLAVPRDIEHELRRHRRRDALRHGRPAGGRRPQPRRARGRARARRGARRGGDRPLLRLDGAAERDAHDHRAARARRRRSSSRCSPRTPAAGRTPRRATSPASRPSPGRSCSACCTSRRFA